MKDFHFFKYNFLQSYVDKNMSVYFNVMTKRKTCKFKKENFLVKHNCVTTMIFQAILLFTIKLEFHNKIFYL